MNPINKLSHNHGVGYLLRNCNFNFDLEEVLPQFTPPAFLASPNANRPWDTQVGSTSYCMTLGVYNNGVCERTLTAAEMDAHALTDEQKYELSVYSLLNLHEEIEAEGGIHFAPSSRGQGIYKVLNLPGNSAACFFDYVALGQKLHELFDLTHHVWMVLPWDADELYLVDTAEVDWESLLSQIVDEFFIEHHVIDLAAAKDPSATFQQLNYWLLPRYSAVRRFYVLLRKQWQEVPPITMDEDNFSFQAFDDYLNYRTVSTLANYRYGTRLFSQSVDSYDAGEFNSLELENIEGLYVLKSRLHPTEPTLLPRCDWVFYGDEEQPLCKANTLLQYFGDRLQSTAELQPVRVEVPPLSAEQVSELRELGRIEVRDYSRGRRKTTAADTWPLYPLD